jgi:2-keto-4-pentenoate hydratase
MTSPIDLGWRLAGVRAGRRHQTIAEALFAAERDRAPIASLAEQWPEAETRDAYAVQLLGVSARVAAGSVVVGHKIGLTARAMQRQLRIDHPTYGHLLDTMLVTGDAPLSTGELMSPHVEAEVAFVLGSPLRGPGVSPDDVLEATDHLLPALEVLDTRFAGWPSLIDSIADNGATARVVLGDHKTTPDEVDLGGVLAIITLNGEVVGQASTEAELEHPARAVAWLANTLAEREVPLEAGHIVLSGARSGAVPVSAGDGIGASLGSLGSVSLQLVR